ncbi:hypothetical protein [Vibrio lentus]|uniref:hypothetical protein n=1 Tax=Vibrio lentus TaxID=136468 RepID=UPI000C85594B|nr:hypothetical protein [Vibrio lentus]PMH10909.1 hypothetical protein BCU76_24585 [Vibrio lentus]PMK91927.1 hypothetical protein BCT89_22685 [Vibrio lentus]
MNFYIVLYLMAFLLSSILYYKLAGDMSVTKGCHILASLFLFESTGKLVYACSVEHDEMLKYVDSQTMVISCVAMFFITWITVEPLVKSIQLKRQTTIEQA